jgi:hypothetical protein
MRSAIFTCRCVAVTLCHQEQKVVLEISWEREQGECMSQK